jgi:hypothetical protein
LLVRERIQTYCQYKGMELVEILENAGISGGKNAPRNIIIALMEASLAHSQEQDMTTSGRGKSDMTAKKVMLTMY